MLLSVEYRRVRVREGSVVSHLFRRRKDDSSVERVRPHVRRYCAECRMETLFSLHDIVVLVDAEHRQERKEKRPVDEEARVADEVWVEAGVLADADETSVPGQPVAGGTYRCDGGRRRRHL